MRRRLVGAGDGAGEGQRVRRRTLDFESTEEQIARKDTIRRFSDEPSGPRATIQDREVRLPEKSMIVAPGGLADETAKAATDMAMEVLDRYGHGSDDPIGRTLRDDWGWPPTGGTLQPQKILIASGVFGRRLDPRA